MSEIRNNWISEEYDPRIYDPWGNCQNLEIKDSKGSFHQKEIEALYECWRYRVMNGFHMGGFRGFVEMYGRDTLESIYQPFKEA